MVNQASESHPPQFRVSLTNEREQTVDVGYGQSLMFSAGRTHQPEGLIIVPAADESDKQPATPMDGCWQYDESQEVTVHADLNGETLALGESAIATFAVYNEADAESCFPAGEYTFQDKVRLDSDVLEMTLTVLITIDESGVLSVKPKESNLPN